MIKIKTHYIILIFMMKFSEASIEKFLKSLDFSKIEGNLIPVITQDYKSNKVLMMAFANQEAVIKSLQTGYVHYFSRTRKNLWKKGEQSGHVQEIRKIIVDCDYDSILYKVKQLGGACHKGYFSCFYNEFIDGKFIIISKKIFQPEVVYTNQ